MPIRSSQQKSIQRRKSEGTGLRISRTDPGVDPSNGGTGLGLLASLAPAGRSSSRSGKTGLETSVDQLKVSEARTRRISDSGLSTSSRNSGTGLAERLSGFAQTVRGLSRPSFSAGHSSPTMTSSSSSSTPTTPGFNPSCALDPNGGAACCRPSNSSNMDSTNPHFDSWDDFLYHYRQGHFPSDRPIPRPQLDTAYPPTPPYMSTDTPLTYLAAPLPEEEERRLRALYSFQILQSGIDPNFERIVQLVAMVMGVKGCMITLVDHKELTVKAQHPPTGFEYFPREGSLCGHTILRAVDDPFVVLDTKADWRFQNLLAVNADPFVRFYAGAPLTTSEGFNVGSLCLIDDKPRSVFTEKEKTMLIDFAAVVMREMELWNDQVQLCIRNRMMRDVTRWVRGCLDFGAPESPVGDSPATNDTRLRGAHPLDPVQLPLPTPSNISASSSGTLNMADGPALISPPIDPVFPTPSGSPTLLSRSLGATPKSVPQTSPTSSGNPLQDRAFPAACILIQATLNVDAVYLVQASSDQSIIPPSGSSVVWNYLDAAGRRKGSVGIVKGGQTLGDAPNTALVCLASSQKNTDIFSHPVLDEKVQHTKRQGSAWVCTDEGCRPHRLGDSLLNAVEPVWERDMPVIKEMLAYVRQETPVPPSLPGQNRLFSYSQGQDAIENDWFGASTSIPSLIKESNPNRRRLLCHTFQGTIPMLSSASNTPYQSCVVVPILGPTMAHSQASNDDEPWAYFVILSASHTKQFSFHERIYLKNFGSCMVTEVMKRRVEAADRAKGTFIKSISHELRTPLHIILGILELLYANPEEPLSETQQAMVYSAEASGKSLIDTINNIIDLANLDPDNNTDTQTIHGNRAATPSPESDEPLMEEMDIRELCERVAESMAKACTDKNLVVIPSWTKPSLSSLTSSAPNSAPSSATGITVMRTNSMPSGGRSISTPDDANGSTSPAEVHGGFSSRKLRSDRKPVLELMVAMDEPERDPDHDALWSFALDIRTITRILTQLVENAIKFTATGFVELSAVALTNSPIPMKPPHPDARAILFTVRDTGKGISADFVQSHLFKRFSQEDPLQVGTGLGMALVKELVKKLGGWMEVWSEGVEGKGCVVKVLFWASPASHPTKSLKDMDGPWQNMSCRFYAGEPALGSDRLFKIMGERMMGQQLSMRVERGNEQDTSAEDMLKSFADECQCNLLVINDDLIRLRAYLSYWTDKQALTNEEGEMIPETPTPLLMLTAPYNLKKLVDEYLEAQAESDGVIRPASIVILNKPIGPLKLAQSLRDCFTPAFSSPGLQTPQGSPQLSPRSGLSRVPPMPMIRSATVPHITTTTLGVNDSRLLSAGSMIKQSFVFPIMHQDRQSMMFVPPHSPGGLVLPPRVLSIDPSPATTPEQESCPNHNSSSSSSSLEDISPDITAKEHPNLEVFRAKIEANAPKIRPQRSIKNYQSQRQLQLERAAAAAPTMDTSSDRPLPRVLIVEDNITNRMILKTFLKKRGIGVVEAENGLLGVERFQEEVWRRDGKAGFEFVLMDLQMPVMDGNLATKKIREFEQGLIKQGRLNSNSADTLHAVHTGAEQEGTYRRTMIFALTGLAADEDKRLAFECGVDGYLTKPVSLKTLGELLETNPADLKIFA
ncbi:His Kinase A domain containing protein [Linnemannia exigua]|uniref:histidine kinase n=1 Tax=Linnemannia exigua TaxID=604196 RepID=A0AAD4H4Y2_9FUNG|nr:His Kinase A domain containing protein [Linnemannia exigua]